MRRGGKGLRYIRMKFRVRELGLVWGWVSSIKF